MIYKMANHKKHKCFALISYRPRVFTLITPYANYESALCIYNLDIQASCLLHGFTWLYKVYLCLTRQVRLLHCLLHMFGKTSVFESTFQFMHTKWINTHILTTPHRPESFTLKHNLRKISHQMHTIALLYVSEQQNMIPNAKPFNMK